MRILMLAQSFAPVIGGEERVVENLSGELAARGHEVAIATLKQPGVEPSPVPGVRIHALRSTVARASGGGAERLYAPPFPDPETVRDLRRVLREERPDIVHAHNWIVHSYLPLSRRSEAALVLSLHDYGLICPTKRLLRNGAVCDGPGPLRCLANAGRQYGAARGTLITVATRTRERGVRGGVDLFLPISSTVAELCRLGPEDHYRLTPNFIGELPSPPAEESGLEELPGEPFALYFGDLTEDKGVRLLVDVYAKLEGAPPLVLIGRDHLGEAARRPGVLALGPRPYPIAIEALRRSLFSVAPSIWAEPFGMVALEAAKAGKPIVASDIGGLRDIVVDGETGLLFPAGDAERLAAALRTMIDDPALRARMGPAAAARAQDVFSADVLVPQVEESYELAIGLRRDRAG
ncbi:MAG TPA: glycosyltransferase family 4 protein [Solirubrobacterales bacterium]|jgi:glycosyltransferase involved in cell wall biosynthesis